MIYLSEKQAAEHIGVSRATVIKWMNLKDNPLPYFKWGPRSIRIVQEELEQWLEQYRSEKKIEKLADIKSA